MLLVVLATLFVTVAAECDLSGIGGASSKELGHRVCKLEEEMAVVERALQEVLQRIDLTIADESRSMEKRKNEFIRFGKRSGELEKGKNEFIRFGKRSNDFIGYVSPTLMDDQTMEKRKNEFIRFGK
ncbi:unnamed protein product [Caenorhabditis bovis]|uniref:Uncharacterized protein n=1 Tax=Caenorhabditis bovis TaxID=2654633 RepID=A0A8S1F041_9PELO|nr:unnamed protein product [Caenorhabditis bovis]